MDNICPVCRTPHASGDAACPVCGFRLQGGTHEFQPIVMEDAQAAPAPARGRDAVLRVVRGPQVGVVYALATPQTTIGRNPQCTIFLNDMTVSREHATIFLDHGVHIISDDHSYNGVWVNNRSVDAKALSSGDFIQIGAFGFIYEEIGRADARP